MDVAETDFKFCFGWENWNWDEISPSFQCSIFTFVFCILFIYHRWYMCLLLYELPLPYMRVV